MKTKPDAGSRQVAVAFAVVEFCTVHLSEDSAPQCAVFNSHRGFRGTLISE